MVENVNFGLFLESLGMEIDPPTMEGIREALCRYFDVVSTASIHTDDLATLINKYDRYLQDEHRRY